MRSLTDQEKARHLGWWRETRRAFAIRLAAGEIIEGDLAGRGFPDPEVYDLTDLLNAIPGVCTVQSCSGHRVSGVEPDGTVMANGEEVGPTLWCGQLWIRLSKPLTRSFHDRAYDLAAQKPYIQRLSFIYDLWDDGGVVDVLFQGLNAGETREEGVEMLAASGAIIVAFFRELSSEAGEGI